MRTDNSQWAGPVRPLENVKQESRQNPVGSGKLRHLSKLIGKGDSGLKDVAANAKKYLDDVLN